MKPKKKLIYLHGFGSSAASGTVSTLRQLLPDFEVIAPDIPTDPADALPFLRDLCNSEKPDVVVGTSMGGMYTQQMRGYNRICVNPAFEMSKKSKMLTVGTHTYFKPRANGETQFVITPQIISHHAEMEKHQFDGITDDDRKQVWGMFADNDRQVNGESLFLQHYNQVVHFSGEHRMDDSVIKDILIPLIKKITDK
ncbi:MAG: YqiA/YcfP family alpha/beta fold hydrolase [Muribaculaceae bacterium]